MKKPITNGPDRLDFLLKFGNMEEIIFTSAGNPAFNKVILEKLGHEDGSKKSFLFEGRFSLNSQRVTGYYHTDSRTGYLEW